MFSEIKHHSPSAVASFLENRAQWFRSKICGDPFTGSQHTARGTAVEAGINFWLDGNTEATTEAVRHAIETWDKEVIPFKDDPEFQAKELEFKQSIAPLVNCGIESVNDKYVSKLGEPKQQYTVAGDIPGCRCPVKGYIDWIFPGKLVVDNKVTGKSPSGLKQAYIIQGAVYHIATGLPVEFHFEVANKTPKVVTFKITDEQIKYGWMLFCRAAKAIENIFDTPLDGAFMRDIFLPNPEAFFSDKDVNKALKDFNFYQPE